MAHHWRAKLTDGIGQRDGHKEPLHYFLHRRLRHAFAYPASAHLKSLEGICGYLQHLARFSSTHVIYCSTIKHAEITAYCAEYFNIP